MDKESIFILNRTIKKIRISLQWRQLNRSISYSVFRYDYKARLSEIQRSEETNKLTNGFFRVEATEQSQNLYVDLTRAEGTCAFLLTVDGFENFNKEDDILLECFNNTEYSDLASTFSMQATMLSKYQGLFMCIFYIDGFHTDSKSRWVVKFTGEPMVAYSISEQETFCAKKVVTLVPSFEKFRFHLFADIRSLCAALSSQSLPSLKDKFLKYSDGVNKDLFTELIFNKLYESFPKIIEPEESTFSVSLIRELFNCIDFSGDDLVSWEEFTTFVIETIVIIQDNAVVRDVVSDEYTIEYEEDVTARDRVLNPHVPVLLMRHVPELQLVLVIPVDSSVVYIFNAKSFALRSKIDPVLLVPGGHMVEEDLAADRKEQKKTKTNVYDCVYLLGKDLYAFSSDDYSINVCKEVVVLGGKRVTYSSVHRILHTLNHPMLCWSAAGQVMCTVSSANTLFGWDIEAGAPKYQSSRHTEVITGIVSIETLGVFATCSMDKTIIFQSAATGRVKGIMRGHARGVKCIDANSFYLISGGFDCEAKVWALDSKEVVVRLHGHKAFIQQVRLMCDRASTGLDYRALTVDDNGEFRLWDISVAERFVDSPIRAALQVFEMNNPQTPMCKIKFFSLSYEPVHKLSSFFATIMAIGSKLLKFEPKKNSKDFYPAFCSAFNDAFGVLLIATGRCISSYEICTGRMTASWKDISEADITCMCIARVHGRSVFIGNAAGGLSSINFRAGSVVHSIPVGSSEITCVGYMTGQQCYIAFGDADGSLVLVRDTAGIMYVSNWRASHVFGEHVSIGKLSVCDALHVVICVSNKNHWCLWDPFQASPLLVGEEEASITALEQIGSTVIPYSEEAMGQRLITFAIALPHKIRIYTMDLLSLQCICSLVLVSESVVYIHELGVLHKGPSNVNYINTYSATVVFVACTDDGQVLTWNVDNVQALSEDAYNRKSNANQTPSLDVKESGLKIRKRLVRRMSMTNVKNEEVEEVFSAGLWRGHSETITALTLLHYYGCIFTVGNDGYARIWNLHQECLGEIKLPNATDEMKDLKLNLVANGLWNLILEKKSFEEEELSAARRLVDAILARSSLEDDVIDASSSIAASHSGSASDLRRFNHTKHHSTDSPQSKESRVSNHLRSLKYSAFEPLLESSFHSSISSEYSLVSKKSLLSLSPTATVTSLADLSFGSQKSYYKNAEKTMNSSKRFSDDKLKHMLEMNRIESRLKSTKILQSYSEKKAGTGDNMVALLQPQSLEDVSRKEEEQSQQRIYKSSLLVPASAVSRPVDREYLKIKSAELEDQLQKELKRDDSRAKLAQKLKLKKKIQDSFEERASLEKRLVTSIMFVLAVSKDNIVRTRKKLRTLDILPSYTMKDVQDFIVLFNSVDVDYSGSLDIREWVKLFNLSSNLEAHQAISMFDGSETRSGGKMYICDLVPMIFPKATKIQRKLITKYAESEIYSAKSTSLQGAKELLTVYDMERLFECYDSKCIGFITLRLIRERLNQLQLPIEVLVEVTQDLYGDDYVSIDEFLKIFRNYIDDIKKDAM